MDIETKIAERFDKAFRNKDLAYLKRLIQGGELLEWKNHLDETLLHLACRHEAGVEIVQALLDAGANLHARDADGYTPLIRATSRPFISAIDLLLKAGADINAFNSGGVTSLMVSCMKSSPVNIDAFNLLIDHGADIRLKGVNGCGALMSASDLGCPGMVTKLLGLGADPNESSDVGVRPLMQSLLRDPEVGIPISNALYAAGASIDIQHKNGRNPLMLACKNDKPASVQWILERAPGLLERTNPTGETARTLAIKYERDRCLQIIDAFEAADHARRAMEEIRLPATKAPMQPHIS